MFRIALVSCHAFLAVNFTSLGQAKLDFYFEDLTNVELPLLINLPLKNGNYCNYHFVQVRPTLINGVAHLEVPLEKPGFLFLVIARKGKKPVLFKIYLEPQGYVSVRVDANDKISFGGKLSHENEYIASLDRGDIPHGLGTRHELRQTLQQLGHAKEMIETLEARENRELKKLNLLVAKSPKAYSPTFLDIICNDIHFYHLVVGAAAMEFQYQEIIFKADRGAEFDIIAAMKEKYAFWDYLFNKSNLEKTAPYSEWYSWFMYDYVMLYNTFVLREGVSSNERFNHLKTALENSRKLARPEAHEAFLTFTFLLWFQGNQDSPHMLAYYNTLEKEFSESLALNVIRPKANEMEKIQSDAVSQKSDRIHFIPNREGVSSLDELLKPFRGKVVLIDIWASWCGPCLNEFEFNYEALQRLQTSNNNFVILFVSRDQKEQVWRHTVLVKNLYGHHILPQGKLEADLLQALNWKTIPRYVLIDKVGGIVQNPAPNPSEGNELIDLIEKELAK